MPSVKITKGNVIVELNDHDTPLDDLIFKALNTAERLDPGSATGRMKPPPQDKDWLRPAGN